MRTVPMSGRFGRPVVIATLAGIILLVAAGVAVVVIRGGPAPAYVGHRWELVKLTHNGEDVPLPAGKRASVSYSSDNLFDVDDTVNSHGGTFAPRGSGYTTADVSSTLAAYSGTDPRVPGLGAALDPLTSIGAERADVRHGQLILQAKGYVFTFDDAGPARRS